MPWSLARRVVLFAPLLSLLLMPPSPSWAGNFGLDFLKIELSPAHKVETVTVDNKGDAPLVVQVRAMAWSQDREGKDQTSPTTELFLMPRVLTIAPGEKRPVRIGSDRFPGKTEKAFRLYFTEVPEQAGSGKPGLKMAMSLGIPLFVRPDKTAPPAGTVANFAIDKGKILFRVENTSPVHLVMTGIRMTGRDAAGAEVCSGALPRSFVLAGNSKPFTWEIPKESCARVVAVSLEAELDNKQGTLKANATFPSPSCAD